MIALNFDTSPVSSNPDLPAMAFAVPASTRPPLPPSYRSALENRLTRSKLASLQSAGKPLFVYGSLMLPSQVARVLGNGSLTPTIAARMTPATLSYHERLAVHGCPFPAVVASVSADPAVRPKRVEGLLLCGLSERQRNMIDYYEGGLYVSVPASVEIEVVEEDSAGNAVESQREMIMVDAVVYIWKGTRAELVEATEREWELQGWLTSSMATGLGPE